ncbi:MAG TPA: hypothetical protein VFE17_00385 [Candidatus Baltobacteraceae bacterium]|nr:hypothetical protein [Candidatus Baltobacteraceae bacterium]
MRPLLAQALIDRGDILFANAAPFAAQKYYRRAIALDGSNSNAVDRSIFLMMQLHTPADVKDAVKVATSFLDRNRDSAVIFADRGLCRLILRDYRGARYDFEHARALAPNNRTYTAAVRTLSRKIAAHV